MHIPDGFLSPQTSGAMYVISIPFLVKSANSLKKKISDKYIPLVAVFAAFAFIIMLFNIPLPGGTSGHAVGTTLSAIVLGPQVSVLTISVSLIIQALFFGDGGILALGANIFNMAVIMSFTGSFAYKKISRNSESYSVRRAVAGFIAGYVSINTAALFTAVELGIQPLLFKDASGHPAYFPYGLNVSVPAMMIGHLTFAGLAEGILTAAGIRWLQKSNPELLTVSNDIKENKFRGISYKVIFLFLFLIPLVPLGLLAPGTAWGEWGRKELKGLGLTYIPSGLDKWSGFWRAPFSKYNIPFFKNTGISYIFSAILGSSVIAFLLIIILLILRRKKNS